MSKPIRSRFDGALLAERLRLYRAGKWPGIAAQAVIGALLLWVVHVHVSRPAEWLAVALVLAAFAARLLSDHPTAPTAPAAPAAAGDARVARRELARVRAALLCIGAAFGAAGVLLFPGGSPEGQLFLGFVMSGLAAGALTMVSFDVRVAIGYTLMMMTPLVLRLVAEGGSAARAIAAAAALFVGFLAFNGLRAERNLRLTVAVREADAERTASLLESQHRLERTAAELQRASEDLRLTFEHMDQGILCIGADGRTSFFNRRMCELTDLPEAFMATRPTGQEITRYQTEHGHFDVAQAQIEAEVRESIRQWRAGVPAPVPPQYFRHTHLGTVLDVKTAPLPGGGFVRTFSDVTALIDANRRLGDSEAQARKLALVAAHTDDAVVITDAKRRIEWVNAAFTRLSGYTLTEVAGRRTGEFLRGPLTNAAAAERIDDELRRTQKASGEILHYRKDGSSYWYALETRAICAEDGSVQHYIGVGRDVTARRAAEQALRAARDEAERASRAKSDFLSAMSHELRTPMNAILGFAQLLEADAREPLSARQSERVGRIREAGAHLLGLINDVLDLARVEAGREVIAAEAVALPPLIEECLVLMRPLATERGIALRTELPAVLPPVRADRLRLKQVLLNLLANAIKYNRPEGRVQVQGRCAGGRVRLAVADTGPGLDAQARSRLFTAFERLGAERGPVEGAGIGLALSRRLLELMDGTIDVASEPGQGSCFTVSLPAAAEGSTGVPVAGSQSGAGPVERGLPAATGTVLYIEDNPVNQVLMQSMLEALPGVRLLLAERAESGLVLALSERPDLILMDIQLPGIDGYEALRRLRADPRTRGTAIVAISANAMRGDVERGRAAGFDDYITKPLEVAALRTMVVQRLVAAR